MSTDHSAGPEFFGYFGFGSLVNRNTLPDNHVCAIPATLKGWRRHWQARPKESMKSFGPQTLALLSVHEDATCEIRGLLIIDKAKNIPALKKREHSYNDVELSIADLILENNDLTEFSNVSVHVHVSPVRPASQKPMAILRSYLDVVMQGYYREYGEGGLEMLMQTTNGFDLPISEDRHSPIYPRHQPISKQETAIFDEVLANQRWRN